MHARNARHLFARTVSKSVKLETPHMFPSRLRNLLYFCYVPCGVRSTIFVTPPSLFKSLNETDTSSSIEALCVLRRSFEKYALFDSRSPHAVVSAVWFTSTFGMPPHFLGARQWARPYPTDGMDVVGTISLHG